MREQWTLPEDVPPEASICPTKKLSQKFWHLAQADDSIVAPSSNHEAVVALKHVLGTNARVKRVTHARAKSGEAKSHVHIKLPWLRSLRIITVLSFEADGFQIRGNERNARDIPLFGALLRVEQLAGTTGNLRAPT